MNLHTPTPATAGAVEPALPALRGPVHVLIVDDQRAVRMGLVRLLQGIPGLPALALHEAASLADACEQLQACMPDLVLLDVDLAGDDGLALLPELDAASRVIVVSSHAGDATTRTRALAQGAAAVLHKADPGRVLADTVRHLLGRGVPAAPG